MYTEENLRPEKNGSLESVSYHRFLFLERKINPPFMVNIKHNSFHNHHPDFLKSGNYLFNFFFALEKQAGIVKRKCLFQLYRDQFS